MSRSLAVVPACLALLLAACGDSGKPKPQAATTTPSPGRTPVARADTNGCAPATHDGPKQARFKAPGGRLERSKTYRATVETNCGTFYIALDPRAPKTGASFKFLADEGFYDGLLIHRIVPGFVFQGGDPLGDGSGGPGYEVTERPPKELRYGKYVVAMAKAEGDSDGSSGSQFFVVTGVDARELPPEYALLGQISGGERVVDKIGAIVTDPRTDLPDPPVVIKTIRVTGKPAT